MSVNVGNIVLGIVTLLLIGVGVAKARVRASKVGSKSKTAASGSTTWTFKEAGEAVTVALYIAYAIFVCWGLVLLTSAFKTFLWGEGGAVAAPAARAAAGANVAPSGSGIKMSPDEIAELYQEFGKAGPLRVESPFEEVSLETAVTLPLDFKIDTQNLIYSGMNTWGMDNGRIAVDILDDRGYWRYSVFFGDPTLPNDMWDSRKLNNPLIGNSETIFLQGILRDKQVKDVSVLVTVTDDPNRRGIRIPTRGTLRPEDDWVVWGKLPDPTKYRWALRLRAGQSMVGPKYGWDLSRNELLQSPAEFKITDRAGGVVLKEGSLVDARRTLYSTLPELKTTPGTLAIRCAQETYMDVILVIDPL